MYYSGLPETFNDVSKLVAIIGSRMCSTSERGAAYALGKKMAEKGLIVVSGLAVGIDTAAHEGALDAGGMTIAVLSTTPRQKIYPAENKELAARITGQGALVFPFTTPGDNEIHYGKNSFQRRLIERDFLQASLSSRVFVVSDEETIKGGSRYAVSYAKLMKIPTYRMNSVGKFFSEPPSLPGGIGWEAEINLNDRDFMPYFGIRDL